MRRRSFLFAVVAVSGLTACGAREDAPPSLAPVTETTEPDTIRSSSGSEYFALPRETLTDWVSFGDCVLTCRVTAERRLQPSAEEVEIGEGVIPREVTLAFDDAPAWSHGAWRSRGQIPITFVDGNGAWTFSGDKEARLLVGQETWMAPGERYALVVSFTDLRLLSRTPVGPDEVSLVILAALRLEGDRIEVDGRTAEPYQRIDGHTLAEFTTLLDNTAMYPHVEQVLDQDPLTRARAAFPS